MYFYECPYNIDKNSATTKYIYYLFPFSYSLICISHIIMLNIQYKIFSDKVIKKQGKNADSECVGQQTGKLALRMRLLHQHHIKNCVTYGSSAETSSYTY